MTALNRGTMRERRNKDIIHYNGESFNVKLLYRTLHSANQLCVYEAVTNWCETLGRTETEKRKFWATIESKTVEKSAHKKEEISSLVKITTSTLSFGEPNASETSKFRVSFSEKSTQTSL